MIRILLAAVLLPSLASATRAQEMLESPMPNAPVLSSAEQTKVIEKARDNALQYLGSLPDFICIETIRRHQKEKPAQAWKAVDTLVLDLSYSDGGEIHKLLTINDKPTKKKFISDDVGGMVATGNFGSDLSRIFSPEAQAKFHWERWTHLRGRPSHVFAYSIEQPHSHWFIRSDNKQGAVAFGGFIYVDDTTLQVMRLTKLVDSLPADWSLREVRSEIDFGYVEFDGKMSLLPIQAENSMVARRGSEARNVATFSTYRKFGAEATIQFRR